eukprot:TRINITY_DN1142_c0_g1_i1.p1 TRINITY_DN1142_c0_g1~~TRINITY_DN1142_c0_g1_i1.p1  ORF type:complete len:240 (+),score=75.04 TRINITY_DN1142_c0_g1_i1:128-847(+)
MYRTLDDLKGKKEEEKDDKKQTTSYAGGEKSGIAIQNPNDLDKIVSQAERAEPGRKGSSQAKITLYENGFTINNGEFRDYTDPRNQAFVAELKEGRVPAELRQQYPNGLEVDLEDKRQEKYRPPTPPKYIAFSGKGVSFGGQEAARTEQVNVQAAPLPSVDQSKPTTTVQLRLHNGQTVRLTLNNDARVEALFTYVMMAAPVDGSFELISGFPPKPLSDVTQTLEDADLLDSTVIQRLK